MTDASIVLLQARDPDFSIEGLVKLVILFLFFVLPVITSILRKARETISKAPPDGNSGPEPMSQEDLQRNLERKLREMMGEAREGSEPAPAPPPPARAPVPRPVRTQRTPKRTQKHVEDYAQSLGDRAESFAAGGTGKRLGTSSAMQLHALRAGSRSGPRGSGALEILRGSLRAKQGAILLSEILGPPKALAPPDREY